MVANTFTASISPQQPQINPNAITPPQTAPSTYNLPQNINKPGSIPGAMPQTRPPQLNESIGAPVAG